MLNYSNVTKKIRDEFMLLYDQKALHEITVKELCQNVGIARTAFYNYYSDIYDVLESIESTLIHDLQKINQNLLQTDMKNREAEEEFFLNILDYISENALWFRVLLNQSKGGHFIYKWKEGIKAHLLEKYHYERIKVKNEALVMEMLASSTIGVFMFWVNNMSEISKYDVEEEALHRLYVDFR